MSALIMPLFETRVKATGLFKDVQGAIDFTAIQSKPIPVSPMAFVVPLGTSPGENLEDIGAAPPLQKETLHIGVIVALKNLSSSYGGAGNAELNALVDAVKSKLHGWLPTEGYSLVELGGGKLLAMKDYTVFWQQEFKTTIYQQGNGNDS